MTSENKQNLSPWKSWFAWYPVQVNDKWVWLKIVYKTYRYNTKHGLRVVPVYGTIIDVLKDK